MESFVLCSGGGAPHTAEPSAQANASGIAKRENIFMRQGCWDLFRQAISFNSRNDKGRAFARPSRSGLKL
jgi:hypothetical protein